MEGDELSNGNFHPGAPPDPFDKLDIKLDSLPVEKPSEPAYEGEYSNAGVAERWRQYEKECKNDLAIEKGKKKTADELLVRESQKKIREAYLKMEVMPLNKDEVRLVKDNKRIFLQGEFNAKIEAVVYKKHKDEHNIYYTKFFRDENGLRHGHEGIITDDDDPVDFQYLYELVDYRLIKDPRNPDTGKDD